MVVLRSNAWISKATCPIDSYTVSQVLQLTGKTYTLKSEKLFDTYTVESPPHPFTKLEFVIFNPSTYGQFRGDVPKDLAYAQAKAAQQMLNNWLNGKAGCILNSPLGEPWEHIVRSETVNYNGTHEEFLFNLANTYGHGIQMVNQNNVKGLVDDGLTELNVEDGLLLVYMPNPNQYYLQKFIIPSLTQSLKTHMNNVLQNITGPDFSVIGPDKAKLLEPLLKECYSLERLGNELRLYKVVDEGKAVLVQYNLASGVIIVTSIGGVDVKGFLGLVEWVKQDTNRLFPRYVIGTGLDTKVPTYAYNTPTSMSYILTGLKQKGLINGYQSIGNFGFALAPEAAVSALSPLIGYMFKLEGVTLKIFMVVSCICDTENLFSYHLLELDAAISYFCGTCSHKAILENV